MAVFRDADALYRVLNALFERAAQDPRIVESLLVEPFVLRFRFTEPEGQMTIDLRRAPLRWTFGPADLAPDLELIQSGDTAHAFWSGRLNVPRAIVTRRVVARGPVSKALKLLPAVKPIFSLYPQVLRDLGLQLLPREPAGARGRAHGIRTRLKGLFQRGRRAASIDLDRPTSLPFPLVEDLRAPPFTFRDRGLPREEGALKVEMFRRMSLIRAFEERLSEENAAGRVPTEAIHLSIGQEATAVGVCFALRGDDFMASTHRGHGHMLAKGADLDGMAAEILGKATGLCGGMGGSMHVTEAAVGAIGANGIVGAGALIAAGAAHSARLRGTDQAAVAFVGDGATNQGMFHEAVNFAAVLDLPVVFVVENNLYGEFTPLERHARVRKLSDRARAYGVPGETVDGNDVEAVLEAARRAVDGARRGKGPTILECLTYRWHGHMEGENVPYRSAEEIAGWKERCPIRRYRARLIGERLLGEAEAAAIEGEVRGRIAGAFERALGAPEPSVENLTRHVYAPEPRVLYASRPSVSTHREVTYSRALFEALSEEMGRDERVYLLGEDVATGGYFAVTAGLVDRFGTRRVVDTPISEYAVIGSAVGAAMTGMRPVAEILFSDFLTTCMDPLVNQAAKLRTMSGGQYTLPLVVRTPGGAGLGMAAQHSQSLEALLTGVPGLLIVAPATPYDAKGLLKAAIRSNNPVVFFENKATYAATGPVPIEDYLVPLGAAEVKRPGEDVTLVSIGAVLGKVLEAADGLAREGIEVEVVDLRTLVPLDLATVVRSVAKTGRVVTVEDGPLFHGFGAEVVARLAEVAWERLKSPPRRVAALDVPIAYNSALENAAIPDPERIRAAVRAAAAGA